MAYQHKHRCLCCAMYTDTLFAELKSLAQNTSGQIFVTEFHWTCFYLLQKKGDVHEALDRLIWDHEIPHCIISDNAPELVAGEFKRKALKYGTSLKPVEAWTPIKILLSLQSEKSKDPTDRQCRRATHP